MYDPIQRLRRELWAARKGGDKQAMKAALHTLNVALMRQARVAEKDIELILGPPPKQAQEDSADDYYSRRMRAARSAVHN